MTDPSTCEHYSVRSQGQLVCRHCHAIWRIDCSGAHWVLPIDWPTVESLTKGLSSEEFRRLYTQQPVLSGVSACPRGSCQRTGRCMYKGYQRCPVRYEERG